MKKANSVDYSSTLTLWHCRYGFLGVGMERYIQRIGNQSMNVALWVSNIDYPIKKFKLCLQIKKKLKQAEGYWNIVIDKSLKSNRYKTSSANSCLYVKYVKDTSGKIGFVILALCVDILSMSNDIVWWQEKKNLE